MIIKKSRGFIIGVAVLLMAGTSKLLAVPPTAINDLSAATGSEAGAIVLNWSAPNESGLPVQEYKIRYRPNLPINNLTDWNSSNIYPIVPTPPSSPGGPEQQVVTSLTPGVTYYFAVVSLGTDVNFPFSPLSNSPGAKSGDFCGVGPNDGEGSATILPTAVQYGQLTNFTIRFTAGANGIQQGGKFRFRVPNNWPYPTNQSSYLPGYVSNSAPSNGASVQMDIEGVNVTFTVLNGIYPLAPGAFVDIQYNNIFVPCQTNSQETFTFSSQAQPCGQLVDISASPSVTINPGGPDRISFNLEDQLVQINTITPIKMTVRDFCNNQVPLGSPQLVTLRPKMMQGGNVVPDTEVTFSLNSDLSAPFPVSGGDLPFSVGSSSGVFYYRIDSTNNPDKAIESEHPNLSGNSYPIFDFLHVVPSSGGITGVSVDTGTVVNGQLTATFTPDGDFTDDVAYINFTMPGDTGYRVDVSSDGFVSNVRTFFGFGNSARIAWYGDMGNYSGGVPLTAPAGTYAIRIADDSDSFVDQSLSLTLSAGGISGLVLGSSSIPLENAKVEFMQNSIYRFGYTDSTGRYTIYGLKPGVHQVTVSKTGYENAQFPVTIPNGLLNQPDTTLTQAAVLNLQFTRQIDTSLPEVWGQVRANTPDWSKQSYGTIHFAEGATTSDAGDYWNPSASSFTSLNLSPGQLYNIHVDMPSYAASDFNVTVTSVVAQVVGLTRRPNIEGQVLLPAGSNPNGIWVSVEAGPDANHDLIFDNQDPSNRYYGGTYLIQNATVGVHHIFGVNNGDYMLVLNAPGFLKSKINVTVAGGVDVMNADFPLLSQGGVITGSVTINGDTTDLDNQDGMTDGYFPLYINCWSPSSFGGSFSMVSIPTSVTQSTANYSLAGLEDGSYQIFINLQGFESSPAGQINASVSGGVGSKNITLQEFTGSLTGTITLPGAATDFNNVELDLLPYDFNLGMVISSAPSAGGTYTFDRLGTGYYTLRAFYITTGLITEKSIVISNGQATQSDLSMTGNTFTISGDVETSASSPFNTLSYIVNQTTPTTVYNSGTGSQENIPAGRIVVERLSNNNFYGGGPMGGGTSVPSYDPKKTFFAYYDTAGAYSLTLSEGVYRIYNNAELDNDFQNGKEIAEVADIIHLNGNLTHDFTLIDGYDVNGTLFIASGQNESGREIEIFLQNNSHQNIASKKVTLTGTSASFTLGHIPSGNYLLGMRDTMSPIKYIARDILVEVDGADVNGKQIVLQSPARIQGSLRIATSGELLTTNNFSQYLPDGFRIEARANPWVQGGFGFVEHPLIDSNNKFNLFLLEGTYDILLRTDGFIGEGAIAQGKKQFVPLTLSGIQVTEGQTLDVGVIDLDEGTQITGTIVDKSSGLPLPNILVNARKGGKKHSEEPISATSNHLGQFTIYGIDSTQKYDITAAPRPEVGDTRFVNFGGPLYGEVTKKGVSAGPLTFQLELAQGIVQGRVLTPDSGELLTPFGEYTYPGASIIMNPVGNTPSDNPLGDIEVQTEADGSFQVKGLTPGVYDFWALAQGYANAYLKGINVGSTVVDVGSVTLVTGAKLFGTLTKPDGSLPSENEVSGFVAVRDSFRDLIIGVLNTDAAGNVTDYTLSGFQTGKSYDVLIFSDDDDITVLTTGLIVNENTELNFVLTDNQSPRILSQAKKNNDGTITINLEFTKPLRNSAIDLDSDLESDDSELDERFTIINGTPAGLAFASDALSSDRRRLVATYTPTAGETQFTLRSDVTFNAVDVNNNNFTLTQGVTFYLGIGNSSSDEITNVNGGTVELDDGTEFSAQAGTFGDDADEVITVTLRAADDNDDFAGATPQSSGALGVANVLGMKAYPAEMASAMTKAKTSAISPFGSFYDIFLPAGVSHFFPEGREAELCLAYDSNAPDPYSLNIYYYNPTTNEYLLEQQNKSVDTVNQRICVNIAHASVFTVLNSSTSILSGDAYTGELAVLNFPNPFNLKQKNVTLQNPGSASAAQTIDGTMIKMSVPSTMSGSIEIQIFNVVGEKVRTINSNVSSGGAHFYLEWDGRNDHGQKVASGTYIARFTIGGANERFFKMAVLK